MSFNRTSYDECQYKNRLGGNVSILSHILNVNPHENKSKCRHQLGFVGGTNVSHISGNLVDLESELRGQTRYVSKCYGGNIYTPNSVQNGFITNDKTPPINTTPLHLPACQAITYKAVPLGHSLKGNGRCR
tara:strand:+ start:2380 stop:2772 length:393 start_codon:yes stop_codon:yes gene_type:complete